MAITPLTLVTRAEWGALEPKNLDPLNIPVKYVGWADTVTEACETKEECCEILRFLQKCNMERKQLVDIKHNFLISKDGTIYEGRGWYANTSNTDPKHDTLYGSYILISRIGIDIEEKPPTDIEMAARDKIIRYGIEAGYIKEDYVDTEVLRNLSYDK